MSKQTRTKIPEGVRRVRNAVTGEVKHVGVGGKSKRVKLVFGLEAQGHIPLVEKMLDDHHCFDSIAKEIGWIGSAVAYSYAKYARNKLKATTTGTSALERVRVKLLKNMKAYREINNPDLIKTGRYHQSLEILEIIDTELAGVSCE